MKNRFRRVVGLAGVAGLLATLWIVVEQTVPASAATNLILISGNFFGDERDELLKYRPGTGYDEIDYDFQTDGTHLYGFAQTLNISSTYKPLAGDFDGDGFDEIFWHSPNSSADWFWDFDSTKSSPAFSLVRAPSVNAPDWIMTVGDYSDDGTEDIFFYRPGAGTETIWDFPSGTLTPTNVNSPHEVNGTYKIFGGNFADDDADDIMWYSPLSGQVYRWDFEPGGFNTSSGSLYDTGPAGASPIALDRRSDGGTDLYLYVPTDVVDEYWDVDATGNHTVETLNVRLAYYSGSGNYLGDSGDDIYWTGRVTLLWDHYSDDTGLHKREYFIGSDPAAGGPTSAGRLTAILGTTKS